ncbi:MAG: Fic family protein [Candidatus Promineifilaceae bacterium]
MNLRDLLDKVDRLKAEIDGLRPIDPIQEQRIMQKFRLDWTYHSNAIEGNSLTYGETRALLMHGITAGAKPLRDYLDIKNHHTALDYLIDFVNRKNPLTEHVLREFHKIIMGEPERVQALTPTGQPTTRLTTIGQYKTMPNQRMTSTGEMIFYASPEETPLRMADLMQWYRQQLDEKLHPLILAVTFHHEFASIHPFDDGNGRMARILMNLMLMQTGYIPVIIEAETKEQYLLALEQADAGDIEPFISVIGNALLKSMGLYLRGAKGENIEQVTDINKKLTFLKRRLQLLDNQKQEKAALRKQTIEFWLTDFLKPFLTGLSTELVKFSDLFMETKISAAHTESLAPIMLGGDQYSQLFEKISETYSQNIIQGERSQLLILTYIYIGFQHQQQNANINIHISIENDDFSVRLKKSDFSLTLDGTLIHYPDHQAQTNFVVALTNYFYNHLNQLIDQADHD